MHQLPYPAILQRAAQKVPGKNIFYIQLDGSEIVQSYAELLEQAERILAGLRKQDLKPQDKIIFQLEHNQDIIPAGHPTLPIPLSMMRLNQFIKKTGIYRASNLY
jgi:non-ribosomal peptide synthetase component E (peptide arylation enzyme)